MAKHDEVLKKTDKEMNRTEKEVEAKQRTDMSSLVNGAVQDKTKE